MVKQSTGVLLPRGLIRRDPLALSSNVLVGACVGIAVVLPWLLGLRGYVARAVVWVGAPILTIAIGLVLRITPVDNPVAVLLLFGGIALLLTIVGLAWHARARGQFSSGDATNLPRTSGDTPQPNPTLRRGSCVFTFKGIGKARKRGSWRRHWKERLRKRGFCNDKAPKS